MHKIHIGDIHLKIPENNEVWYIKRFLDFSEVIRDENPDELIITGDLFDKTPTALETALLMGFLMSFECPIYIIEGNHDRVNRKTIRANFLENLMSLMPLNHVTFAGNEIVDKNGYRLVSNRFVRSGKEIPVSKNLILLSHIRHELKFAGKVRKAEYDLKKLEGFKLCLLSDIHTTFKYAPNIFYSTSPYRTTRKTITSLDEIDDSLFGYNIIKDGTITHKELNLPNVYILKATQKVGEIKYKGIVEVEYEISQDELGEFKGENVRVSRTNSNIEIKENLYEVIFDILKIEYKVKEPGQYLDLLTKIIGKDIL